MKKNIYVTIAAALSLLLFACASSNVKRFTPDLLSKFNIEKRITQKTYVSVVMPKNDKNAILCRTKGKIYLPNKSLYSKYIEDAFKKSLVLADRLTDEQPDCKSLNNFLLITLNKVDFSTASGKWYINGTVVINNSNLIEVQSVTDFGTALNSKIACNNAANAFNEAVNNFVNDVLTNKSVRYYVR